LKIALFFFVALIFIITPVHAQLLSEATGLVNRLDVEIGRQVFEVKTVSNFDVRDFEFDEDEKRLTIFISSGLENNLGDLIIPQSLLGGNMTFYLNDEEYFPNVSATERITFVTLNFTGTGDGKLDIFGSNYFFGLTEKVEEIQDESPPPSQSAEDADDSIMLMVLAVILIAIVAFVAIRVKKKN